MPETTSQIIVTPVLTPADTTKHNEEIARKQAAQDISGQSTSFKPGSLDSTASELDKLAEAKSKENEAKEKAAESEVVVTPATEVKKEVTPEDVKAAEDAAAKIEADKKAEQDKADEYFKDAPKLPANASPKSSEAFSAIKIRAAKDLSEREATIELLKKEKAELEKKLENPVPAELENEIKELREWRAKLDVEVDPKFKEFDKQVSKLDEFIYSQLKQSPVITDSIIAEIKSHGGPSKIKIQQIFDAIKDPMIENVVKSKLSDIAMAKFNKDQAIKTAKENIGTYLTTRQKQVEKIATAHTEVTKDKLDGYIKNLDWIKERTIDSKLDASAKKDAETHNAFVGEIKNNIQAALTDDSPEMRAIMITGMAQLLYLQKVHESTVAKLATAEKALTEAQASVARFKGASVSRLRESGAVSGAVIQPKKADNYNTPATQALDDLAKQIMETRARAAAGT